MTQSGSKNSKAKYFLECIQADRAIDPLDDGWTDEDLFTLAAACVFSQPAFATLVSFIKSRENQGEKEEALDREMFLLTELLATLVGVIPTATQFPFADDVVLLDDEEEQYGQEQAKTIHDLIARSRRPVLSGRLRIGLVAAFINSTPLEEARHDGLTTLLEWAAYASVAGKVVARTLTGELIPIGRDSAGEFQFVKLEGRFSEDGRTEYLAGLQKIESEFADTTEDESRKGGWALSLTEVEAAKLELAWRAPHGDDFVESDVVDWLLWAHNARYSQICVKATLDGRLKPYASDDGSMSFRATTRAERRIFRHAIGQIDACL